MTRVIAVLRPAPGNDATAARVEALGLPVILLPLFTVVARAWSPPTPDRFDALILTSASAVRLAGPGLDALRDLPVFAVGAATAAAAANMGLRVHRVGLAGASDLATIARKLDVKAAVHLTGVDHVPLPADIVSLTVPVYASEPVPVARGEAERLVGAVLLVHSVRAARRVMQLFDLHGLSRADTVVAVLSPAIQAAIGMGWATVAVAAEPNDPALLACARTLVDR